MYKVASVASSRCASRASGELSTAVSHCVAKTHTPGLTASVSTLRGESNNGFALDTRGASGSESSRVRSALFAQNAGPARLFSATSSDNDTDRQMKETRVPESPFERAFAFGSLAASLAAGAAGDRVKQSFGSKPATGSRLSEQNAQRLAEELCRLRGAGLKIGQMLSIQDESVLPPEVAAALAKVRTHADVMPRGQLERVLEEEWGPGWEGSGRLQSFDRSPFAAASIGQVHRALLAGGQEVAVKVQFPGVARSIDSDLANLQRFITFANFLPPGLFIDRIIAYAKAELTVECDYVREAAAQERMRQLLHDEPELYIPPVVKDLSTPRILVTHFAPGEPLDGAAALGQEERDRVCRVLLRVTLRELFELRFMQTDPNWANFLYCRADGRLTMLDFGAARQYPKPFIDNYLRLVWAAANNDRAGLLESSIALGLLTGDESQAMMDAHVSAGMAIGRPFLTAAPFDFAASNLTLAVRKDVGTFAQERLAPPPTEVYSLHRRLAGAYSTCMHLHATIPCRDLLQQVYEEYSFD